VIPTFQQVRLALDVEARAAFANGGTAKIWLRPIELEKSRGYSDPQIGRILRIAGEHEAEWLAEWEKRCGSN